jgi:hypothetical protein
MKPMRTLALAALATLALSLAPAGSDAARPERADSFAVTNVRVFDGRRVIPDATVVVRNGRIRAVGRHLDVPPNLPEIDGSGKTLMPGIIDSHGHAGERRQLERTAQFGITTLMDMQSANPFATQMYGEQRRGEAHDRADFFSAINPRRWRRATPTTSPPWSRPHPGQPGGGRQVRAAADRRGLQPRTSRSSSRTAPTPPGLCARSGKAAWKSSVRSLPETPAARAAPRRGFRSHQNAE